MKEADENNELLAFFKALADANRLKIVGLLARQSYTVEQLADMLGLGASTVSHHLSKLAEAGLVSATARSYYNDYRLETGRLEQMARRLLADRNVPRRGCRGGCQRLGPQNCQRLPAPRRGAENHPIPAQEVTRHLALHRPGL